MTPEDLQAMLVMAKLTMVRQRNALQAIRARAEHAPSMTGQAEIKRLAAVALRERVDAGR